VPLQSKNESWKFPKDFFLGVAGAAYQIEGAVKAEGRGPSIWDVLTHRVVNYISTNDTGDIADNNYYQYKEGAYLVMIVCSCTLADLIQILPALLLSE
jgi:beta-glucosidase/6-phospho-beta-glucosidase/beta-galactosidase